MPRPLHALLYSQNDCPFCAQAREVLQELKVPFEERNVMKEMKWRRALIELTGDDRLPTIILNDTVLIKPGEGKLRATINYERYRS
jgi:glutaredoxin